MGGVTVLLHGIAKFSQDREWAHTCSSEGLREFCGEFGRYFFKRGDNFLDTHRQQRHNR